MNSGLMVFILFFSHRESLILREIYEQRQFKKKTPANRYTEIIAYMYHQN